MTIQAPYKVKVEENIDQYKVNNKKEYERLVKGYAELPAEDKPMSFDDKLTVYKYYQEKKKNPEVDFIEFYKAYNPNGTFASPNNYRENYKSNPDLIEESDAKIADRMFNELAIGKARISAMQGINTKKYGDFIFQMAPRYEETLGSIKEGIPASKREVKYSNKELTELTGSLVGTEDEAIPTAKARAMMSLTVQRDDGINYLQDYLLNNYQKSGINVGPETQQLIDENKFIRQNPKTGNLEFYNPKANAYQLVNTAGLDIGDMNSLLGDGTKLISEVVVGTLGFVGGTMFGSLTGSGLGPAGTLVGGKTVGAIGLAGGSYYGNMLGEVIKSKLGNTFFPGLNVDDNNNDLTMMQIMNDPVVQSDARFSGALALAGPIAEKIVKVARASLKTGKLLTKKDLKGLSENAEEAQIIADNINQKLADIKLGGKLKDKKFFFGIGESTADPETLFYLNSLMDSDPAVKKAIEGMNDINKGMLKAYFNNLNKTYKGMKDDVDTTEVMNEVKKIIGIRQNTTIGKEQDRILNSSKLELDSVIEGMPSGTKVKPNLKTKSGGDVTDGSYIRTAIGDAVYALEKDFAQDFKGVMEVAKDQQVNTTQLRSVLQEITKRRKDTAFKNFLPINKLFKLKKGEKLDAKYLIQTMQDLKAFDRKMRTGAVAADVSETEVRRLIGGIMDSFKNSTDAGVKNTYKILQDTNQRYFNAKRKLTNTLSDMVAIKNGKVKIQDSDLFETSFTPKAKGYKERIDEIHNILKDNPDNMNAYKNNILNLYKREVVRDGVPDPKLHKIFVSETDVRGYGYGLKKFFGDDYGDITKAGNLIKKVEAENVRLETLRKDLAKSTLGKIDNLNPTSIINKMFDANDKNFSKDVMRVMNQYPKQKAKLKTVLQKEMHDRITVNGNFDVQRFENFFGLGKENSPMKVMKEIFKDDPGYMEGIETIHKAIRIMARKDDSKFKLQGFSSTALNHLLRTRVGMFTPEGRALTAGLRLAEKANQKSFARLLTDKEATKKLAQLNNLKIPKSLSDEISVNAFLKKSKFYNQVVTQLLGDITGVSSTETGLDMKKLEEIAPKPTVNEVMNISMSPTSPDVNLFADTQKIPPVPQPQQVAQAEMPTPEPVSSGIGALNPQAQAQNYAGLFPDDDLGQAIANRGPQVG